MILRILAIAALLALAACSEGDGTASTNNLRTGNSATCEGGFTNCDPIGCIDTSTSIEHCGGCGITCATAPNAVTSCNGSCQLECESGFVDLNGDLGTDNSNGCEFECTPTTDGVEICDGLDNDCDMEVDEGFDVGAACTAGLGACERAGETQCAADGTAECSATPRPPTDERCGDDIDNDCDGEVDEGDAIDAQTYFRDDDEDTYGQADDSVTTCVQPDGYTDRAGDCDDTEPTVYENAVELCDGLDNDCDLEADETFPTKGDACTEGLGVCEVSGTLVCETDGTGLVCDAQPGQPTEMPETTCDNIDADCDGVADNGCDDDNDNWCDENFTVTNTTLLCNGGQQTGDCNDADDAVYPSAPGLCDGKDNDCNGQIDDIQPLATTPTAEYTLTGMTNPRTTAVLGPVASAPMTDGFCVVAYNQPTQTFRFARYRPGGTTITRDLTIAAGALEFAYLLDVAVIGDRCAALYSLPNLSGVVLAEWNTASAANTVSTFTVTTTADLGTQARRAALGVGLFGSVAPASEWVVAWYNILTIGTTTLRNVQYRHIEPGLGNPSSNIALSTSASPEGDIAVGPALNASDSFTVMARDTATRNRVTTVSLASDTNDTARLALDISNRSLFRPALESIGGQAYLSYLDTTADELVLKEIATTYTYGRTATFAAAEAPARDYTNSRIFVPAFQNAALWLVDTAGDIPYEIEAGATFGGTAYDHDALTYLDGAAVVRHHVMSGRVDGDVLQFLVLSESRSNSATLPDKDHSVFVAEYTCF